MVGMVQHAVIAGTEARISSTHRVGCTEGNEFAAIDALCQAACGASLEMEPDSVEQSFSLWMQVEVSVHLGHTKHTLTVPSHCSDSGTPTL